MRTKKTIINVMTGWGTQLVKIIVGFIARTIFIQFLSVEYLGLTSTFSNVMQILSFTDLGIGIAITVEFYKPIAEENLEEQIALFQLFKKLFRGIGLIILVIGLILTLFLNLFVKDMPNIPYVRFIFLIFVVNSAVSYFTSHKSSYFLVNQRNYVVRLVHSSFYVLMLIIQSIVLILTRNYILYLMIQLLATLGENVAYSFLLRRDYRFLLCKDHKSVTKEKLHKIFDNTKAVAFFKIGNAIVSSTDSLIISKIVGLVAAGIYSNYYMIMTGIESVLGQIFSAMIAGVGDLHVREVDKKQKDIFEKIMFMSYFIYAFAMIILVFSINDLIYIWLGTDFMFSVDAVVMMSIAFWIRGYRNSLSVFREACGLYNYTKYTTLFEAIANFGLSLIFVNVFGVAGVFLGTIVSFILFGFWKEPLVLYRHVFHSDIKDYWKKFGFYSIVFIIAIVIAGSVGNSFLPNGFGMLICKICLITCVIGVLFVLLLFRTREYAYFQALIKGILMEFKKK